MKNKKNLQNLMDKAATDWLKIYKERTKGIKLIKRKRDEKVWLWDDINQKLIKRKCDECVCNRWNGGCALRYAKDCAGCRFFIRPKRD